MKCVIKSEIIYFVGNIICCKFVFYIRELKNFFFFNNINVRIFYFNYIGLTKGLCVIFGVGKN